MDILSHGLYGGVAFGKRSKRDYIISFLFGVGPDLFSFGILFVSIILGFSDMSFGKIEPPNYPVIPEYVHHLYNLTHSLVLYGIFFATLWFLGKKSFSKLTLGWPLHILVDIPTHSSAFFPTPFLWPASSFYINGIPWSEPYIFFPNVVVLVSLYTYWYLKKKKIKKVDNFM
ncbi:MAG TPA: hypothetical protein VGC58_02905 [Candidatus Paceibacterota bacterium]